MYETIGVKESLDAMAGLSSTVLPVMIEAQKHVGKLIENLDKFILLNCILLGCNVLLSILLIVRLILK